MKKFGVIHHSHNWYYGTTIPGFDTISEAKDYVKNFKGSSAHREDEAYIIEFVSKHNAEVIDQTEHSKIYGFKEEKK